MKDELQGTDSQVDSKHQQFYESLFKKDEGEVNGEIAKKVEKRNRKKLEKEGKERVKGDEEKAKEKEEEDSKKPSGF